MAAENCVELCSVNNSLPPSFLTTCQHVQSFTTFNVVKAPGNDSIQANALRMRLACANAQEEVTVVRFLCS